MTEPIRLADVIQVADQIELRIIDLDTGETRRYRSTVEDITAAGILVAMPIDRRAPAPVREGTIVVVAIWKGYADHLFKTRVLKKIGGHIPQLLLARPRSEDISRTPRREFFRADTRIPTKIRTVDENDEKISLPAVMTDLSAGGCRLHTSRHLKADTPVTLDFDLPFPADKDEIDHAKPMRQIPGEVRTALSPTSGRRLPANKRPIHILGVEFPRLDNVVRNSLLRYVAFRQRELLNQLKEEAEDGVQKPRTPQMEELEERLNKVEGELKEAGQEVPQVSPDQPREEESTVAPPEDSIDTLFAPSPPPGPEAPAAPVLRPSKDADSGKTILLVEDEAILRQALAEALQSEGHSIIEAGNGQEALEMALRTPVDLVITDLMMPKMNGWRLLSSLRGHNLDVPVIIITGYMSDEGQEVLTSKDIAGFLVKPIELRELAQMVRQVFTPAAQDRRQRILAVDDEEDARLLVSTCLEQAGFEVETAQDGQEALDKVKRFQPDLVLLDVMMPRMDGFETCQRLRAQPATASLPVIVLTAKSSAQYVKKAVSLKINGYIVKPFDSEALVDRIRQVLQGAAKG